jgi:hypothetical protein
LQYDCHCGGCLAFGRVAVGPGANGAPAAAPPPRSIADIVAILDQQKPAPDLTLIDEQTLEIRNFGPAGCGCRNTHTAMAEATSRQTDDADNGDRRYRSRMGQFPQIDRLSRMHAKPSSTIKIE